MPIMSKSFAKIALLVTNMNLLYFMHVLICICPQLAIMMTIFPWNHVNSCNL